MGDVDKNCHYWLYNTNIERKILDVSGLVTTSFLNKN